MYILWLILSVDKYGRAVEEVVLGFFPPSNYWTLAFQKAETIFFPQNVRYEFVQEEDFEFAKYADKLISAERGGEDVQRMSAPHGG